MPEDAPRRVDRHTTRRLLVGTAYVASWLVLTAVCAGVVFLHSSRETTLASHDAVLRPDLSGHVVLLTGPVLPDVRVPAGGRLGVQVSLGKTDATSTSDLIDRYALIASQPEGPEARVREVVGDLAVDAVVRGGRARAGPDRGLDARGPRPPPRRSSAAAAAGARSRCS